MPQPAAPPLPAYPIVGLHFRLQLLGADPPGVKPARRGPAPVADEAAFQEATGISMKMDSEAYREGGENRFEHRLPKGVTYQPLKLTRGLMSTTGQLAQWCEAVLRSNLAKPIQPRALSLQLLEIQGAAERILRVWWFHRAWPQQWEISGLNSGDGKIVVETLELSYNDFQQGRSPS